MPDVKKEIAKSFERHDQGRSQSDFAKKKKPEEEMKGNPCPEYPKEEKKKKE